MLIDMFVAWLETLPTGQVRMICGGGVLLIGLGCVFGPSVKMTPKNFLIWVIGVPYLLGNVSRAIEWWFTGVW